MVFLSVVNLLSWAGLFGLFFGYPSGYFLDKLGLTRVIALATALVGVGSFLSYVTTVYTSYFAAKLYVFALFFFCYGRFNLIY